LSSELQQSSGLAAIVWLGPVRNESAGVEGRCQCHTPERDAKPVKPAQDSDQGKIGQAESEQEWRLEEQLRWLQRKVRVGEAEQHSAGAVTCVKTDSGSPHCCLL